MILDPWAPAMRGTRAALRLSMLPADDEQPVLTPQRLAAAIRAGVCPTDAMFDAYLPSELRSVSTVHWTPLLVSLRVARWLAPLGVRRVVDVGSGAGKFCVAAALAGDATYVGLEHRPRLVSAAKRLAETFRVADRVAFRETAVERDGLPPADAYYFYNPFGENLLGHEEHLDDDVEVSATRHASDVAAMERALEEARIGTIVVTYNGFGGRVPPAYAELRVGRQLPSILRLYEKLSPSDLRSKLAPVAGPPWQAP